MHGNRAGAVRDQRTICVAVTLPAVIDQWGGFDAPEKPRASFRSASPDGVTLTILLAVTTDYLDGVTRT